MEKVKYIVTENTVYFTIYVYIKLSNEIFMASLAKTF